MPTKIEKDAITGKETTGHDWDGVRELDTPLPKWWVYVFYATIIFSIVYVILYPSLPGFSGYYKGVLGYSSRVNLDKDIAAAKTAQKANLDRIASLPMNQILTNKALFDFASAGGKAAFADNCAPCHGPNGVGRPGYPALGDDVWLWGGKTADITYTIQHGVRNGDEKARTSAMPAFGTDGILKPNQIDDVAEYVLSLTKRATDKEAVTRGGKIYAEQCAACHGDRGQGDKSQGAPALNDAIWLYGSTKPQIVAQIGRPQMGVMPAWKGRLDEVTIKMLTAYVYSLGGAQRD